MWGYALREGVWWIANELPLNIALQGRDQHRAFATRDR
jgi:hypothetical protein